MEYRTNRRTGDKISVLGVGAASAGQNGERELIEAVSQALENGVNYFDMAPGEASYFAMYGKAFGSQRKNVMLQIPFGANYTSGQYGWTTDLEEIRRSIDWQLHELGTDYIDYGFIHCLDEIGDWESYRNNGVLDYILTLQKQGVVKHIGLSTHTPALAQAVLDTGKVDMLMFSINPAYDYRQGQYAYGAVGERQALYRRCEAEGVGISVMKPFSGGRLLDGAQSPFGKALTKNQCIQYALDKPGVLTVLPGIRGKADMEEVLKFTSASEEERDYSVIGSFTPEEAEGRCVYCHHCQPCPVGIDIGLVNKYYDLAKVGDTLAADHYRNLEKKAGDCVQCGHCNSRCPFRVDQMTRMREIKAYFSE